MARRGMWMLERLKFQYCDWMGSSQGMREYVQKQLPAFKEANPQIEITETVRRNRFPFVEAHYRANHSLRGAAKRSVGVKHLEADDIATHVRWLRSTVGTRSASRRIPPSRKVTLRSSIQGMWTPDTFAAAFAAALQRQARH